MPSFLLSFFLPGSGSARALTRCIEHRLLPGACLAFFLEPSRHVFASAQPATVEHAMEISSAKKKARMRAFLHVQPGKWPRANVQAFSLYLWLCLW
ncbi:MAG: hypothetical protein ABI893_06475 [Polaromonas sp.]